jgi:hypothetical protein
MAIRTDQAPPKKDKLDLTLRCPGNPLDTGPDGVLAVLQAFDASAVLAPTEIHVGKPYSHEAVLGAVREQAQASRFVIGLGRSDESALAVRLQFSQEGPMQFAIHATVAFDWVAADPEPRARVLIELVRALSSTVAPGLGWIHGAADLAAARVQNKKTAGSLYELRDVAWLNVIGRELVEQLGRERVATLPAFVCEDLPDGAVLFLTRPTPIDFAADDARHAQAQALAHLTGMDEAATFSQLRARSKMIAPVEKKFDPDIAEVIERLLAFVNPAHQGSEIASWSSYRPPAPSEVLPAAQQPPADVSDPEALVARWESLDAEQLIALLHSHVPAIAKADPATLPEVDAHFYRGDYPKHFPRARIENDLVPAVGAFLGMLLVQRLGGRWAPRKNLDESAVIVGNRAWLVFLRARHYLQSKEDAVHHSLTQFFRAAARKD